MERLVVALARLVLLVVMLLGGFAYACRNSLATALLSRALSTGLSCSAPDVQISASLTQARVAPLRCEVSEGPVKAFETSEARLRLLRLRIREAHLEFASVDYRERDVSKVRASASGDVLSALQLRQRLVQSMLDASEMYSLDAPEVSVNKLTAKREGRVELVMHGFKKTMDGPWNRSQAERVECPSDPLLAVRDLDMRVQPRRGSVSAALLIGVQPLGPSARALPLKLEGRQLDSMRPRFSMAL